MDRQALQERFGIIGSSPGIRQVMERVMQVARTDISVLVWGESGVGKELIAQAIHQVSPRRQRSMIVVNCGAIPEGLIESELFGAEKGAYTGAVERRNGYFEEANGGTIFLDEIGEMPLAAQVRLLRVLESGEYSRVGSATVRKTDVRVLAATNKDLGEEVQRGRFREDLYYRLSTVIIPVPPLRERKEDILPIFEAFLQRFVNQYKVPRKQLDDSARQLLLRYRWPGNIRELRNVAEQAVVLARSHTVTADSLEAFLRGVSSSGGTGADLIPLGSGETIQDARERELIYRALLEMRMELRELKEHIAQLIGSSGPVSSVPVPRDYREHEPSPTDRRDYLIVRPKDEEAFSSLIEDVSYEIEGDETPIYLTPSRDANNGEATEEDTEDQTPFPTLEDAESQLISQALDYFGGNRRQTAKALGISERTLYRKIKDME